MLKVSLCSVVCQLAAWWLPAVSAPSLDLCPLLSQLTAHLWQHYHRSQLAPSQVSNVSGCVTCTKIRLSYSIITQLVPSKVNKAGAWM